MVKRVFHVVSIDRGTYCTTGKVKPYHWILFMQIRVEGKQILGIAHQLHGMPGAFYYLGPEEVDLATLGPRKEQLEIGEVDDPDMQKVYDVFKSVPINTVESSGWNCQDWTLDGLDRLRDEGLVYNSMTRGAIKNWLKED